MARRGAQPGRLRPLHARRRAIGGGLPAARVSRGGPGLLLSRRPAQVHRNTHARHRRFHAQPAGSDVRGRRVRLHLRILEGADQFALRAAVVSHAQDQPEPFEFQGDCWRLGRLANLPDRYLRGPERRLRGGGPERVGRDAGAIPQGDPPRAVAAIRAGQPSDGPRRTAHAAQAHHLRRGRDDDRVRPALPFLPAGSEPADRLPEAQRSWRPCAPM